MVVASLPSGLLSLVFGLGIRRLLFEPKCRPGICKRLTYSQEENISVCIVAMQLACNRTRVSVLDELLRCGNETYFEIKYM